MSDDGWKLAAEYPESDGRFRDEILVEYENDLGRFHAIGLFARTIDGKVVFLEVLTGTAFSWHGSIIRWKKFEV